MRVKVLVPQIGEAVAELMLVAWHKRVGDKIEKGDLLFEIDSDKAIVEVDAFVAGTLTEIIEPGESAVMPQQVVAIIETADEVPQVESASGDAVSQAPPHTTDSDNINLAFARSQPTADPDAQRADVQSSRKRPKISPKARRLAKQVGLDWGSINGSGADGLIVLSDVERAIEATGGRKA